MSENVREWAVRRAEQIGADSALSGEARLLGLVLLADLVDFLLAEARDAYGDMLAPLVVASAERVTREAVSP